MTNAQANSTTVTLKITSPCGTYKETMKFRTHEEAQTYAKALRAEGSKVVIAGTVGDVDDDLAALRKVIGPQRAAALDALYK